jgi:hypothetical protein
MQVYALALVVLSPASPRLDAGMLRTSLEVSKLFFSRSTFADITRRPQRIPPASRVHASLCQFDKLLFLFFFCLRLTGTCAVMAVVSPYPLASLSTPRSPQSHG